MKDETHHSSELATALSMWQIAENKFMQLKASEVSVEEKDKI